MWTVRFLKHHVSCVCLLTLKANKSLSQPFSGNSRSNWVMYMLPKQSFIYPHTFLKQDHHLVQIFAPFDRKVHSYIARIGRNLCGFPVPDAVHFHISCTFAEASLCGRALCSRAGVACGGGCGCSIFVRRCHQCGFINRKKQPLRATVSIDFIRREQI